jgi:hypothetical protein
VVPRCRVTSTPADSAHDMLGTREKLAWNAGFNAVTTLEGF